MADSGNVVDELVVKLRLDAKQYDQETKKVDNIVDRTEKKLVDKDKKGKKRDDEQKKRMQESTKAVKQLSEGFSKLSFTLGAVLGIGGGAAGILGAITALTGMEIGLRKAAVSTGMSNREMQAWGATARRLGTDAQSGIAAISALAREQQQFTKTGAGPTMAAFARMGVNVGPGVKPQDMLAQAQQIYRNAGPGQRNEFESSLSAAGVSDDLIVMIKSEKDAREAYTQSLNEAASENRKALDAVSDALTGMQTSAVNIANAIATVLQPAVQAFADWASRASMQLSAFVDKIVAAGGGFEGLQRVLDREAPLVGAAMHDVTTGLTILGQTIDVVVYGFKEIGRAGEALFGWLDGVLAKFGIGNGAHPLTSAVHTVGAAVKWAWTDMVADARSDGAPIGALTGDTTRVALTSGARASLATGGGLASTKLSGSMHDQAVQVMSVLSANGFSPAASAAIAANMFRESSFRASAFNPAGGGQGAMGSMQWRGARIDAFRRMFGVAPDQATFGQQVQFMLNDPYERNRLNKALEGGGTAQQYGERVAQIFEGVGKNAEKETSMRGALANQFSQWQTPTDAALSSGESVVHISGPVTVQANNPQEFVGAITRVSGVQSYNSAVR